MPRCLIFNKPYGVPSQFSDPAREYGRTLRDYIPVPEVYPVGRLDRDSEGLLLLTDDGALQHQLTDPLYAHARRYLVQVEGVPLPSDLERLRLSIVIQGRPTLPAQARLLADEPKLWSRVPPIRFRKSVPASWIELELREGRNRQVRRMTAAIGFPTLRLVRWSIGPVTVEGLAPGEWGELRGVELAGLQRFAREPEPSLAAAARAPGRRK